MHSHALTKTTLNYHMHCETCNMRRTTATHENSYALSLDMFCLTSSKLPSSVFSAVFFWLNIVSAQWPSNPLRIALRFRIENGNTQLAQSEMSLNWISIWKSHKNANSLTVINSQSADSSIVNVTDCKISDIRKISINKCVRMCYGNAHMQCTVDIWGYFGKRAVIECQKMYLLSSQTTKLFEFECMEFINCVLLRLRFQFSLVSLVFLPSSPVVSEHKCFPVEFMRAVSANLFEFCRKNCQTAFSFGILILLATKICGVCHRVMRVDLFIWIARHFSLYRIRKIATKQMIQ